MFDPKTLFARHGLRCTRQRLELYSALAGSRDHPTAEDLFSRARDKAPGLSLATVYNTLEVFCRAGLCRKIPCAMGGARFDADVHDHLHICTEDGVVIDVPEDLGERLLDAIPQDLLGEIESRMGVRLERVSVDLFAAARERRKSVARLESP